MPSLSILLALLLGSGTAIAGESGGAGPTPRDTVRDHRSGSGEVPSADGQGDWLGGSGGTSDAAETAYDWLTDLTNRAEAALKTGDYASAEAAGREIIAKDPSNPLGWRVVALAQDQQGDRPAAQATVDEGLRYAPQDDGLNGLKRVLAKGKSSGMKFDTSKLKKDFKDKEDDLKRPKPRAPDSTGMLAQGPGAQKMLPAQMGEHAAPMSFARPELHSGFTRRGLEDMQAGDLIAGIKEFTRAVSQNPNDSVALRWRALAREKAGDHEGAVEDADRALAVDPKDAWALKTKALALLALKKAEEALEAANKAIDANATDADAFRTRAMIHKTLGDDAAMVRDLSQAAALNPAFAALYRSELARVEKENAEENEEERGGSATTGTAVALGALILGGGLATALGRRKKKPAADSPEASLGVTGFEVTAKLGQGGMGEVWLATDRALRRQVAIKRLRSEIAGDARMRRKFLKEARTVAALKHPNIVEIHSVLEEGSELLLVFEHIDGRPLDAILAEHGKLTLEQALEIVRQTAAALDYAHGRGVIHQDLKPGNIMVGAESVKVMDFGIARRVADDLSTLSRQEVAGTPLYMAPEQEKADPRPQSDVYALGLCFYEMVSGVRARPKDGWTPLTQLLPGLPPALDGVLAYTFDPDPAKRYPSAGQLSAALAQVALSGGA